MGRSAGPESPIATADAKTGAARQRGPLHGAL